MSAALGPYAVTDRVDRQPGWLLWRGVHESSNSPVLIRQLVGAAEQLTPLRSSLDGWVPPPTVTRPEALIRHESDLLVVYPVVTTQTLASATDLTADDLDGVVDVVTEALRHARSDGWSVGHWSAAAVSRGLIGWSVVGLAEARAGLLPRGTEQRDVDLACAMLRRSGADPAVAAARCVTLRSRLTDLGDRTPSNPLKPSNPSAPTSRPSRVPSRQPAPAPAAPTAPRRFGPPASHRSGGWAQRFGGRRSVLTAAAAVAVAAVVLAGALSDGGSTGAGRTDDRPSTPAVAGQAGDSAGGPGAAAAAPADPQEWAERLADLYRLRAQAVAERDPQLLGEVYLPQSPLGARDQRLIAALTTTGRHTVGFAPQVIGVDSVSVADDVVTLTARDRIDPFTIADDDGGGTTSVAGRPEGTVTVVLRQSDGRWLIDAASLG